jgi:integrase
MRPLTDIAIQNLKSRAVQYEVPDPGARGLRIAVHPTGRKSFIVRYRNAAGRTRKLTLSPGIKLAAARKLAADALLEVAQGRDPAATKKRAKHASPGADDRIERLAARFIEEHAKRKTRENSWRQTVHVFENIVLPVWKGRLVHDIKRRDIRELIESVAKDRPVMANRALARLSRFFAWLIENDVIENSPTVGVKRPVKEKTRERVLSDPEIAKLWSACDAIGGPATAVIKLLLLTGQRRNEIAHLKWSEVKDDTIEIASERMKGRQTHTVPLSTQARAIIEAQPRISEFVFGHKLTHFERVRPEIDRRMGDVAPWTLHDLRRTCASVMARIGVLVTTIEKLLAHHGGSFKGVAGIYQRHSFLPEMSAAVQKWSDHIEQLVTGKVAKVVKLPLSRAKRG